MSKQSSIDFMHDAFMEVLGRKRPMTSNEVANIWLQAREMHRQEIIDAVGVGSQFDRDYLYGYHDKAEQYYNETYGGKP